MVEAIIAGDLPASDFWFRFDFKRLADRVTVQAGVEYQLSDNWLIDSSPKSPMDLHADPAGDPSEEELDYALIRLADPAGTLAQREWITLPSTSSSLQTDTALHILEHPDGAPLQLALHTKSIMGVNSNGTRVRHRTTTEPGSSGSPCFDAELQLIALHHAGDPLYYQGGPARFNQGIPIHKVRALLQARARAAELGR